MTSEKDYDTVLFQILSSEETIFGFFDRIFDFLYRKTDFFKLKGVDSPELGLANGEAEKIVRSVFCRYMEGAAAERRVETTTALCGGALVQDYVTEETVVTTTEPDLEANGGDTILSSEDGDPTSGGEPSRDEQSDGARGGVPAMDSDSYNGASYEGYAWSQSLKDADIRIKVPDEVCSGRRVHVHLLQSRLRVEVEEEELVWRVLKEGELRWPVNVEESTWTLVPRDHIHICVQKLQERWWDAFFADEEPRIDLRTIDPSIPYEELDADSRAKIRELMHEEHMRRTGRPTPRQEKIENILKEAWEKEGSPFIGQPFDPSIVDVNNS